MTKEKKNRIYQRILSVFQDYFDVVYCSAIVCIIDQNTNTRSDQQTISGIKDGICDNIVLLYYSDGVQLLPVEFQVIELDPRIPEGVFIDAVRICGQPRYDNNLVIFILKSSISLRTLSIFGKEYELAASEIIYQIEMKYRDEVSVALTHNPVYEVVKLYPL